MASSFLSLVIFFNKLTTHESPYISIAIQSPIYNTVTIARNSVRKITQCLEQPIYEDGLLYSDVYVVIHWSDL